MGSSNMGRMLENNTRKVTGFKTPAKIKTVYEFF